MCDKARFIKKNEFFGLLDVIIVVPFIHCLWKAEPFLYSFPHTVNTAVILRVSIVLTLLVLSHGMIIYECQHLTWGGSGCLFSGNIDSKISRVRLPSCLFQQKDFPEVHGSLS